VHSGRQESTLSAHRGSHSKRRNWTESAPATSRIRHSLGDWNIPLGTVVFVITLGREAVGNLIGAARVQPQLAVRDTTGCVQLIDFR
jgi:hypothetical protein